MLVAAFTVATSFAGRTASTDSFHMDGQKPACHYLFSRPQLVCVCVVVVVVVVQQQSASYWKVI